MTIGCCVFSVATLIAAVGGGRARMRGQELSTLVLQALFLTVRNAVAITLPTCDISNLDSCGPNQTCIQESDKGQCQCIEGYKFNPNADSLQDACIKATPTPPSDDSSHPATAAIMIFIFLGLITCFLVLAIRRYNLISWIRQKIFRRENSIMYEDVMIGQDDPPIAA